MGRDCFTPHVYVIAVWPSFLKLSTECQSRSYDAMVAHATLVCCRYLILEIGKRTTADSRTLGTTDKLGDEFTYRYGDVHYSKQKVTELVPGKKVVWLVLDAHLDFTEDKSEWNGTEITFEISKKGNKTEVCFTHVGLVPDFGCFDSCSNAWGFYINGSLRNLITTSCR